MTCTGAGVRCVARCVEQHRLQGVLHHPAVQATCQARGFLVLPQKPCESLPRTVSSLDPCIMLHDPACIILPAEQASLTSGVDRH